MGVVEELGLDLLVAEPPDIHADKWAKEEGRNQKSENIREGSPKSEDYKEESPKNASIIVGTETKTRPAEISQSESVVRGLSESLDKPIELPRNPPRACPPVAAGVVRRSLLLDIPCLLLEVDVEFRQLQPLRHCRSRTRRIRGPRKEVSGLAEVFLSILTEKWHQILWNYRTRPCLTKLQP